MFVLSKQNMIKIANYSLRWLRKDDKFKLKLFVDKKIAFIEFRSTYDYFIKKNTDMINITYRYDQYTFFKKYALNDAIKV